jgi:ABC-2 type transport system ATP-binding protein
MIRVENLSKSFGSIKALNQISFEIPKGEITIFAGADGAGKSTLFKILIGLLKKDKGEIFINGEISEDKSEKLRKIAGYMPERFSLYEDLTVEENLDFFGEIYGVEKQRKKQMKKTLLEKTGMAAFGKRRAGALSGGMKQKLALSTILLSSPEIIILDEPTTGVDPLSRIEFFNIIEELKNEGRTILISTPYLDEAEKGDYIILMKRGEILKQQSLEKLKDNFTPKLFKLTPSENIFKIMDKLKKNRKIRENFYIRGNFIHYLHTGETDFSVYVPHSKATEIFPKLEDIYIYYERIFKSAEGDKN